MQQKEEERENLIIHTDFPVRGHPDYHPVWSSGLRGRATCSSHMACQSALAPVPTGGRDGGPDLCGKLHKLDPSFFHGTESRWRRRTMDDVIAAGIPLHRTLYKNTIVL